MIDELNKSNYTNLDTGGMDDSQTITEEELTSTKQEKPKSEEIIAKVEELGQNLAPTSAPAPAPEPTEGTWWLHVSRCCTRPVHELIWWFGASGESFLISLYLAPANVGLSRTGKLYVKLKAQISTELLCKN